ncbi:O-antigen ligase family protein [Longirhabdus pacifica]|uniref:O-antigen ligase family protein n=1 Tax=Longirhabdus pacifica TaxID=2305227 RepID=UPI0010090E99|nr:O-antigen ligase family protein [Longirhabdus pacifica]
MELRLLSSFLSKMQVVIICTAIGMSVAIGCLVLYEPLLTFCAVIGLMVVVYSLIYPERTSLLILLSAAVSIQYIIPISIAGFDLLSIYKLMVIVLIIPYVLQKGLEWKLLLPLTSFVLLLAISLVFSSAEVSNSMMLKSFIGLSVPFLFLAVKWKSKTVNQHMKLLCWLAPVSVCIGSLLHLINVYPMFVIEFTGAFRLQGASIPSHLAMLACVGFVISLLELKRVPQQMLFFSISASVNFLILLATGTRGPLIVAILMVIYFIVDMVMQYVKGRIVLIIPILFIFVSTIAAFFLVLDNMKTRSISDSGVLDTSGRTDAWSFYLERAADTPWFGKGLGSSLEANDGTLYDGFVVPHNEYIRFYYDTGLIGAVILFLFLCITFHLVYKQLQRSLRPYFLCFIIGFLLYTFTDNTLSTIQFILPFCWYLSGLYHMSLQFKTKGSIDGNEAT